MIAPKPNPRGLRQELAELAQHCDSLEHRSLALCIAAIAAGAGNDDLVVATLVILSTHARAWEVRQAATEELAK